MSGDSELARLEAMGEGDSRELIPKIHASGRPFVIALTGGGSRAIAELLSVPGASATVLEAIVPYAPRAMEAWLGGKVDHFCSEPTARAMAMAAFERARALSDADPQSLRGIGVTASLATTRPKRGPHRIHVAWQSADATVAYSCELVKDRRSRLEEEAVAAQLVMWAIAEACGVAGELLVAPSNDEAITRRAKSAASDWTDLLLGRSDSIPIHAYQAKGTRVLFPGAFNPLHAGHREMAQIAAERFGAPVTFEISITNVDKPSLDFLEIEDRLHQLAGNPVLLTRAPTFVEKSALAPGAVFVVGADTIARIAEPRYYAGDIARRDAAIASIADRGCRFLVFARTVDDRLCVLPDLNLPDTLRSLCDEVPPTAFRHDISSTRMRTET
jgi:nicotinamide mononucleotide (NMN) deamidase PncC